MIYLAACVLCVIAVEVFVRLQLLTQAGAIAEISRKTAKIMPSSRISDHWKEKALQRYSRDMAVASCLIGAKLLVLGAAVFVAGMALDHLANLEPGSLEFLVSVPGLVLATVVSIVYLKLRKQFVAG